VQSTCLRYFHRYTIAWKRSIDGGLFNEIQRLTPNSPYIVPLEGVVEYKSLPSGLHNIEEDLVYFYHDKYAGISAFRKGTASAQERNAHFVAVGAMLPLRYGRLGRAWLHAESLKKLSKSVSDTSAHYSFLTLV
jgi:hypothetical protein